MVVISLQCPIATRYMTPLTWLLKEMLPLDQLENIKNNKENIFITDDTAYYTFRITYHIRNENIRLI